MLSEKVECRAMLIHRHVETHRLDITSHEVLPLEGENLHPWCWPSLFEPGQGGADRPPS